MTSEITKIMECNLSPNYTKLDIKLLETENFNKFSIKKIDSDQKLFSVESLLNSSRNSSATTSETTNSDDLNELKDIPSSSFLLSRECSPTSPSFSSSSRNISSPSESIKVNILLYIYIFF